MYDHKCVFIFVESTRYSCQILMRLEFSRHILKKTLRISSFMKILPVGAKLLNADGQTDRHDEANRPFSQF